MPIKGLTDRGLAFPEIGQIRKGAVKSDNRPGMELKYWRVEFGEGDPRAAEFRRFYGAEPSQINVVLPFNEIDQVWDAWLEAYTAGRMVGRSDGEYIQYLVDPSTGDIRVLHALDVVTGMPVPHTNEIGSYKTQAGKAIQIKWKNVGRLKVVIPELKSLAYMTVHTTSIHDIINVSAQLEALRAANSGRIAGIPLLLKRVPKMISVPAADGSRARRLKYMISLEAHPDWVKRMLATMQMGSLPAGSESAIRLLEAETQEAPGGSPSIPVDVTIEPDPDEDEGYEQEQEAKPAPKPAPKPKQEPLPALTRPYAPGVLIEKIREAADAERNGGKTASDALRKKIQAVLVAGAGGNVEAASAAIKRLTGFTNMMPVGDAEVLAIERWLKIVSDSGGDPRISWDAVEEYKLLLGEKDENNS